MGSPKTDVEFFSFSVASMVADDLSEDIPQTEMEIVQEFIEWSHDGLKFSAGYKSSRNGYCVAITLPPMDDNIPAQCATFWHDDPYQAWSKAFIACGVFNAVRQGWRGAYREHNLRVIQLQEDLKELRRARGQK